MYEAGIDWRRVDVGVMGDRKEINSSSGSKDSVCSGGGIKYDKLVVDASNVAPR